MELFNVKEAIDEAVIKSRKLKEGIIRGYWNKITDKLSTKSTPLWIKDETLYVTVEDSIYLHHMSMNKEKYLKNINILLKGNYIKEIIFKVSKVKNIEYQKEYIENSEKIKKEFKSELKDLSLEEKIEVLKKKSLEREKDLSLRGFKKCKSCGVMFLGEDNLCKLCSLKKKSLDKVLEDKNDNK